MVPKNDAEHMKLIGRAMFVAANVEIFGPIVAIIVIVAFVIVIRKRKTT